MKVKELIEKLQELPQGELFMYGMYFYSPENVIDINWNGNRQSVQDVIQELKDFDQNTEATIDVEDGYIYHAVTGVHLRYWSEDQNYYDFIT